MEYKRHWNKISLYLCFSRGSQTYTLGDLYLRKEMVWAWEWRRKSQSVPYAVLRVGKWLPGISPWLSVPLASCPPLPCCCATVPFTSWGIQLAALKCVLWGKWEHDAGDISQRRQHSKDELGQDWHVCAVRGHFGSHSRWALTEAGRSHGS